MVNRKRTRLHFLWLGLLVALAACETPKNDEDPDVWTPPPGQTEYADPGE